MPDSNTTTPLPTFRSLFAPTAPEPRRRHPRDTASLARTVQLPVLGTVAS